jgi:endonuclease IV
MIKYGIKLWNVNTDLFAEARSLMEKGVNDLIELYILPGEINYSELSKLKGFKVEIHCPHSGHEFDIFKIQKEQIDFFNKQIKKVADYFDSEFIIVHAGQGDDNIIFKEKINKIKDKRILIENKPYMGINKEICYGYSLEQLKFVKECGYEICLDIGHAIKSAKSQNLDYKEFLKILIKELKPLYYHVSDGDYNTDLDEHMNLGEGNYDLQWIKKEIEKSKEKNTYIIFEVPKDKSNLGNDIRDIIYYKNL